MDAPEVTTKPVDHPQPETGFHRTVNFLFGAKVMGFLALVALGMAAQELFFGVSHDAHRMIRACQIMVFFLFLAEYFKSAWCARDRRKFFLSASRILDLLILVAVLASFLPQIEDRLINAQALQLLRLTPILFFGYFGTRELSHQLITREVKEEVAVVPDYFRIYPDKLKEEKQPVTQEELLSWLSNPNRSGFYLCRGQLTQELAQALSSNSIPSSLLANALSESSFPRSIQVGNLFLFSGVLPYVVYEGAQLPVIVRSCFVAVFTSESVLLAMADHHPMAEEVCEVMTQLGGFAESTFAFRAMAAVFKIVNDHYELAAAELEQALRSIELTPQKKRGDDIYQAMYSLRRNLTGLKSDLWRISHLLQSVNDKWQPAVFDLSQQRDYFALLGHSADFLYETFGQLEDSASALLDLRINMVSFEMNRFMGLLAIITAVGLIPTTISGFLGMNIAGVNFPITLGNVVFIASMLVVLALYVLRVCGWLKIR